MEKLFDIVGVGESGVDLMFSLENFPDKGEKSRTKLLGKYPGGMIGNFCSAASKQGMKCGVVTAIGSDEYGELLIQDYKSQNIDIENLIVVPEESTFYCLVFLESDGEKRLVTVDTTLNSPPLDKINYAYLSKAKYVHMNSMDYQLVDTVTKNLFGTDTKISLDYESHADRAGIDNWLPIYERVSVLFLNEDSAISLLGNEFKPKLAEISFTGPEYVIVTCGEKGGIIYAKGRYYEYKALKTDNVVDTTGAGDCFNATFLARLIDGYSIDEAATFAAKAAAISIQKVGARSGQPTKEETIVYNK